MERFTMTVQAKVYGHFSGQAVDVITVQPEPRGIRIEGTISAMERGVPSRQKLQIGNASIVSPIFQAKKF